MEANFTAQVAGRVSGDDGIVALAGPLYAVR